MDNSKTLIIIGIVLLIIGVLAGIFTTTQNQLFGLITISSIPYQAYTIPLLVGGMVLIIIGAVIGKNIPYRYRYRCN